MRLLKLIPLVVLVVLAGCETMTETVTDLIGAEVDNSIPPADLVDFEPSVEISKVWSDRFGKGTDELFIPLIPAPYKEAVYTADRDGRVIGLDAKSGEEIWSERSKGLRISGGPGVGENLVFVGTSDAEVQARDAESGEEKWISNVSSEVLAPPVAAGGIVVVKTGDGKLFALDAATGKTSWIYDRTIPVLTLRGTGAPVIYGGIVIAGFDSGRLVALDLTTGKQQWEIRLAVPSGRSDLERMVDVDSEPTIADDVAYVASFQASIAAVSTYDGQLEWTREISSYSNLAVDEERVYATDESGYVWGLDRGTGESIWKQEGLRARKVTGPTVIGNYIVVGDFEGYLHWLNRETGAFVNRVRLDKSRIIVPCKTVGDTLLAFSSSGELAAYKPQSQTPVEQD